MAVYKIMFGVYLLLLLSVYLALAAAQSRGGLHRVRVLHLFRVGLSLSAVSYLLRLMEPPHRGQFSFFVLVTGFLGTTFLWLGWIEHWKLRSECPNTHLSMRDEENEPVPEALLTALPVTGAFPLTSRAHQVLLHAQYEASRRHDCCVDTDHLLLGLLRDPDSAGVHLLDVLGAGPEKVHLEILGQMAPHRKFTKPPRQKRTWACVPKPTRWH